MSLNSTQISYLNLTAYMELGRLKYLYFVLALFLYLLIIGANVLLITVIALSRSLHEPMYLLLISLFVNQLYGSAAIFPFLLMQILRDVHTVSPSSCFLQNFFLYSYGGLEYLNLGVMSYDRYLAICLPLQYSARMTPVRMLQLVCGSWLFSVLLCMTMSILASSLQLCGSTIQKVYCDNYATVRLACIDTTAINIYGLVVTMLSIFGPLVLIVYTYIKILRICLSGCKQARQKAVSTCTPHLASMLNFSLGASFEILQSRFDMSGVPNSVRVFLSLYWLTCQPLFNPLMYGLNVAKIRIICKGLVCAGT